MCVSSFGGYQFEVVVVMFLMFDGWARGERETVRARTMYLPTYRYLPTVVTYSNIYDIMIPGTYLPYVPTTACYYLKKRAKARSLQSFFLHETWNHPPTFFHHFELHPAMARLKSTVTLSSLITLEYLPV